MIESHFENIDQVISKILLRSVKSIDIASAWFTHTGLMKIIENQAVINSVKIRIIISDDPINGRFYPEYDKLIKTGIEFFVHKGNNQLVLMHNKFAILDSSTVITGSFNWTRSAETNLENIVVSYNDSDFASKYTTEFERICTLSSPLGNENLIAQDSKSYNELDETTIWSLLRHFHETEYNPTPHRIWKAMCGTRSLSIAAKTSKMPFYNTIDRYADSRTVLNDLILFFDKNSSAIASEFNYDEKEWKKIVFPGLPFNFLDHITCARMLSIRSKADRYGRKWNNQEIALLSDYLLKTNDVSLISIALNRDESSIIAKAKRILYDDKQLRAKWLDIQETISND